MFDKCNMSEEKEEKDRVSERGGRGIVKRALGRDSEGNKRE